MRPLFLLVLLAAPAAAQDEHLSEVAGVRLLHGWANATDGDSAPIYMEIENTTDAPVTLTGARMPEAGASFQIVGAPFKVDDDPVILPELRIPAGGVVDLSPESVYLLATGIDGPFEEGDEVELLVTFARLGDVELHVEIEDEDAKEHSHAGHSH